MIIYLMLFGLEGWFLLQFAHFIFIIQLVIKFCNAFMKLCCDLCHPQVSIFSILEMVAINFVYNISRIVR